MKSKWVHNIGFFASCMQKLESIWKTTKSYALHGGLFHFSQWDSFIRTMIIQQHISALVKSAAYCAVTPYSSPRCAYTSCHPHKNIT